jgi:SOS-response transcriptional repressor LexA
MGKKRSKPIGGAIEGGGAELTERQREVYDYIRAYFRKFREGPTRQEIQAAFGFKSPNAAQCHVVALIRKGALAYTEGQNRGIIPQGLSEVNMASHYALHY